MPSDGPAAATVSGDGVATLAACATPGGYPRHPAVAEGPLHRASLLFGERATEGSEFPGIDEPAVLQPYVGGGLADLLAEKRFESSGLGTVDDDDLDADLYAVAGVDFWLTQHLYLAVDLRVVREEFLDYGGFDLDYEQLTFGLGVAF